MIKKLRTVFQAEDFIVFLPTMFLIGIASGLFNGVMNNYLAEVLLIKRAERGVVEFLRELPGMSLILLISLLYRYSETRIIRLALLVSFCGLAGLLLVGSQRTWVVAFIVIWSTGEHLLMPVRQSIAIHSSKAGREGRAIGVTDSCGSIGSVAGYYTIPLIFALAKGYFPSGEDAVSVFPFKAVFLFSSCFLILAILLSARLHRSTRHVEKERFYVRKKYTKYYIIEMFFGARKQVFLTFAPFVLILDYKTSTERMAVLYAVYATVNIFLSPLVGKLVDKVGYKVVLLCDAVFLIIICFLYGFAHRLFAPDTALVVVSIVFMLDGMLFTAGMARSLYARSISDDRKELTATLSTGISINHFISIIIALLGGRLWEKMGIEVLFSCAACFGMGAFVFSCFLPKAVPHRT